MSLGMPIVSTDCRPGGARMLLENDNGIITPIGDYNKLAQAILCLIENEELSNSLGFNAYASLNRFKEDHIINQWRDFINRII